MFNLYSSVLKISEWRPPQKSSRKFTYIYPKVCTRNHKIILVLIILVWTLTGTAQTASPIPWNPMDPGPTTVKADRPDRSLVGAGLKVVPGIVPVQPAPSVQILSTGKWLVAALAGPFVLVTGSIQQSAPAVHFTPGSSFYDLATKQGNEAQNPKQSSWRSSYSTILQAGPVYTSKGDVPLRSVQKDHYVHGLAFFCRQEIQLEKKLKVPVFVRLGSLEQCNILEQKQ